MFKQHGDGSKTEEDYTSVKEELDEVFQQILLQKQKEEEDRKLREAHEKAKAEQLKKDNMYNAQKDALKKLVGYWKRFDNKHNPLPYWGNYKWMEIKDVSDTYFRIDLQQVSYQEDYVDIYVKDAILGPNTIYNYKRGTGSTRFVITLLSKDKVRLEVGDLLDEYDGYGDVIYTWEFVRVNQSEVPEEFR